MLDFVFIDADHSYEGCKADIEAWFPKVKPGGLLSGHDYDNPDFPEFGVKRAVDEFAARHGHSVELGDNLTWFIRL
jgi:predicted O-methyltransferase YrrM